MQGRDDARGFVLCRVALLRLTFPQAIQRIPYRAETLNIHILSLHGVLLPILCVVIVTIAKR